MLGSLYSIPSLAAAGPTPDCVLNTGTLTDTLAPLVPRYIQNISKSGIVNQDPPPATGDAIFNTPFGPFSLYQPIKPVDLVVQVPNAEFHMDNDRNGTENFQRLIAGFCNLRVSSDLAGGAKATLSIDTFDATSVFNQTNGKRGYYDPANNKVCLCKQKG